MRKVDKKPNIIANKAINTNKRRKKSNNNVAKARKFNISKINS